MALYPYQERVDALLRTGRNVILQAPTGAGKTRAALFPFLDSWRADPAVFPHQCIYAVPLRVLANQFEAEYRATVATFVIVQEGDTNIGTG
jgi:CRISPR-associated endonuclease/helicase Cas3